MFDLNRVRNGTVRQIYGRALRRRDYIAASIRDASGANRAPILASFSDENAFNAYARWSENGYVIEVAEAVPLLLLLLFEKLLSDPQLFPWIDAAGPPVEAYEVEFVVDPADFTSREPWGVRLNVHRSYAASTLADIMVAFCQMHELGHVLCGHVDANRQLTGRLGMAELVEREASSRSRRERERAWEVDADAVATSFLVDHIAHLLGEAREDGTAAAVFGCDANAVEHIASMVIVSLWALFAYVRGARYKLRLQSDHPHPLVRTYYIKGMLIAAIQRKMALDVSVLGGLIDTRLEEMLVTLQALGLSHNHLFDDRYVAGVERAMGRVLSLRERHRKICAPWAWFSWDAA